MEEERGNSECGGTFDDPLKVDADAGGATLDGDRSRMTGLSWEKN